VGEWIAEIEEDQKEEQAEKDKAAQGEQKVAKELLPLADGDGDDTTTTDDKGRDDARSTTPPMSPPRKREKNPNARALRDVAAFRLADDVPSGSSRRHRPSPRRWYFTKPRYVLLCCSPCPGIYSDTHTAARASMTFSTA
jgi:RNA polymerase II subunit A-like phosphatase